MATSTILSSSMAQAIELLDSLTTLLMAERTSLKDRDSVNIEALLSQKTELLKQLEANSFARTQLLLDAGLEGNNQGMLDYLSSLPNNSASALGEQWETLKEVLHNCKAANQVNGTILHRSKSQVETLLNILRGQSGEQKIYTDAGKSRVIGGGNSIAKA
jgi:flagellar biosynthesis/type III secretory pathway chaperone